MAELERIFHSLGILLDFGPDRSNFAYFVTISYSQTVKAITTYLLISNTSCTAMLWAAGSGNSIFFCEFRVLCRERIGEDRQMDDSRQRKGLRLFVHIQVANTFCTRWGSYTRQTHGFYSSRIGSLSNGDIADNLECPLTFPNHPIFCILHRHLQLRNG